jgi:acyl carrier protein
MKVPKIEELIVLIRQVAEISETVEVSLNSTIQDLGIDSIHMMLIVSEIDTQFNVVLELDQLYNSKTILDLHSMILSKLN